VGRGGGGNDGDGDGDGSSSSAKRRRIVHLPPPPRFQSDRVAAMSEAAARQQQRLSDAQKFIEKWCQPGALTLPDVKARLRMYMWWKSRQQN